MTGKQLAKTIAIMNDIPKSKAESIVEMIFYQIYRECVAHEGVSIRGFGKFYLSNSPEKIGRNFKTGEKVVIPPKQVIKFKAAR